VESQVEIGTVERRIDRKPLVANEVASRVAVHPRSEWMTEMPMTTPDIESMGEAVSLARRD
jgi:hypothetical protein